jgi:hypothetical protein
MSVSDALEITKLLEMVSSFAGTPGQNQLVVSASAAATCGIGAMAKTSAASIAPSTFVSLFASLFAPLSTTNNATHAASAATTIATCRTVICDGVSDLKKFVPSFTVIQYFLPLQR